MIETVAGLLLTAGGLGGVGWLRASALGGRCRDLDQLRRALTILRASVAFARVPAAVALARAARAGQGTVAEACARAAHLLESGASISAGEAWWAGFEAVRDRLCLLPEDLDMVREFCVDFGRVDAPTQESRLADALARVHLALEQAGQERQRLERLYRFSGLAAGLAVAIMLL